MFIRQIQRKLLRQSSINSSIYVRSFSKKVNSESPYKVVRSRRSNKKDETKLASLDPSLELLAPSNRFPFILPGNVGIAWYDTDTTVQMQQVFVMEQLEEPTNLNGDVILNIQTCPTVLRKGVSDLFPYRNLEMEKQLSVVTISLKPNMKLLRKNNEIETERLAQIFLLTAKTVCDKLRKGGFWADFINPFSGRPYLYPLPGNKLYEADEKFRCLDFQIFDIKDCKIVSNDQECSKRLFTGNLFTNAPSKKNYLNDIFTVF